MAAETHVTAPRAVGEDLAQLDRPRDPARPNGAAHDVEARLQEIVELVRQARKESTAATSPEAAPAEADTPPAPVGPTAAFASHDVDDDGSRFLLGPTLGEDARLPSRLGQMLIDRGLISQAQLDSALEYQKSSGTRLGEALVAMDAVSAADVALVLAEHLRVPFVDVRAGMTDATLAGVISEDVARRYCALPVARWGQQVVIAMTNPNDVFALDDLRLLVGAPVVAALADPAALNLAINRTYAGAEVTTSVDDASADLGVPDDGASDVAEADSDGPLVRLVNALLDQAIDQHASDIHIEPSTQELRIRFRVDGVLHRISSAPLSVARPLVSRLKVVANLDIAQRRMPQDGRFSIESHGRRIDVRVATMPTSVGEAVALRILDRRGTLDIASLGLTDSEAARFLPAFEAAQGGVFVTGPTGSGKTSTLYAVLKAISTTDKNIISVEDPAEYVIDGTKQVQVNVRAGLTFPVALRAILRADPDVVMIGEVRDTETARIAAEASITGHLVLATLHTTSAAAAPIRLIDMGMEPYFVSSSLTCVVAQRLARNLCANCAESADEASLLRLRELGADDSILEHATIRKPVGCPTCLGTGYQGRSAIYEIMPVTETIRRMIVDRATTADIECRAVLEGMDTLRVAGLRRVGRGLLSIEELVRVTT